MYLIGHDVIGKTDFKSLAGKVILESNRAKPKECKTGKKKVIRIRALNSIFLTNTLIPTNRFGSRAISTISIIEEDLSKFLKGEGVNDKKLAPSKYKRIFYNTYSQLDKDKNLYWKTGQNILLDFFDYVEDAFPEDWKNSADSYLLSSRYVAAFIRFLRYHLINKGDNLRNMPTALKDLKQKIETVEHTAGQLYFDKAKAKIATTRHSINKIFEFLKSPKKWKP